MHACVETLEKVPDWCTSKWGWRESTQMRSTPPRLALAAAGCSKNFEPSNCNGTPWARPLRGARPQAAATPKAALDARKLRRATSHFGSCSACMGILSGITMGPRP